jgi:hypothetical protein
MPPQQAQSLLDFVDNGLNFGAHFSARLLGCFE